MSDRHPIGQFGGFGGDWPADTERHVEQPALAEGGYIAPIGDDPTTPGPAGHCRGDGHGLYSVHWFDRYGDFMRLHPVAIGQVPKGYQLIPGPRPLAPRPPDPQPGGVWRETPPAFSASPSAGNLFEPGMDGVPPVLPRWKSYR